MGVRLSLGVRKLNILSTKEIWNSVSGVNVVQAYMRMERFKLQEFTDRLTNGTGAYGIELSQHREVKDHGEQ